jgi:SAM-dependent methyltransferase
MRPINGLYKGRGRNYLSLLACPVDHAALRREDDGVRCAADPAHFYPFHDGTVQLVPARRREAINAISAAHEAAGDQQGWTTPDGAQFRGLPQTGLPGYPDDYWSLRAAATVQLWHFLETIRREQGIPPIAPTGEAAVIGAGLGWLAYGLDVAGYTTVALDARAGSRHGLNVYPISRYLRVQADLDRLPLASAAFDWLIFQDGLTPLGQDQDEAGQGAALDAALRYLRPGGWVAVMDNNSPTVESAAAVDALFEKAGLEPVPNPQWDNWRARLSELRDRLKGRDPDVPPVLVARKPR